MEHDRKERGVDNHEPAETPAAAVSRRQFLKMAGVTGAVVGLGGGIGGLLAACGGETTTTTTATTPTTGAPTTQATTATTGATTTVTAKEETGRLIKIGVTTPKTGPLASMGPADDWASVIAKEYIKDGMVMGDGKKHPVEFILRDCQSDPNRASQIAGDLIMNDKADLLIGAITPMLSNPVADQAEALGTPFITGFCLWEAFVFGRGKDLDTPFNWTFAHTQGASQMAWAFMDAVDQLPNNKKVAMLVMNNPDGHALLDEKFGAAVAFRKYGYEIAAQIQYNPGDEDYTKEITEFKKAGADVLVAWMFAPDFQNFWKQSLQQGFNPKIPVGGLGPDSPQGLAGMENEGLGIIFENGWSHDYPYICSLSGLTCPELAERWEKDTGMQEIASISWLHKYEWAVDILKRTKDPDDKNSIVEAIKTTKMNTVCGPIDFTAPIDSDPTGVDSFRPHPNVYKPVWTAGQWVKGTKWPLDYVTVGNPWVADMKTVAPVPYKFA